MPVNKQGEGKLEEELEEAAEVVKKADQATKVQSGG